MNYESSKSPFSSTEYRKVDDNSQTRLSKKNQQAAANEKYFISFNDQSELTDSLVLIFTIIGWNPTWWIIIIKIQILFPLWKFLKGFHLKRLLKNISSMMRIMAPGMERTSQGQSTEQFKFWTLESFSWFPIKMFLWSIFNQHIINTWRSFSPNCNLKYQLIADATRKL